jgi:hypothetical protein
MDWRVKSFESEARAAFAFLIEQGFTVGTEPMPDTSRRPASVTVRFHGPETAVDTSLVLGFAGEDSIHTTLRTVTGSSEFGPAAAHKGHELKKALSAHAESVRDALPPAT